MHHVFAKIVLSRQKTKNEKEKSENAGDKCGFMGRARKNKSSDS
jgi:hypothetical protein